MRVRIEIFEIIIRVAKSDDPRDPGSCKIFGSRVKFSNHEIII